MSRSWKQVAQKAAELKYVLLVAAVGLLLIVWPFGSSSDTDSVELTEETRIASILGKIEGVGEVEVLLSDSGAVVVCEGADSASVCLQVTQAVRCYTGLGADKVEIFKME